MKNVPQKKTNSLRNLVIKKKTEYKSIIPNINGIFKSTLVNPKIEKQTLSNLKVNKSSNVRNQKNFVKILKTKMEK